MTALKLSLFPQRARKVESQSLVLNEQFSARCPINACFICLVDRAVAPIAARTEPFDFGYLALEGCYFPFLSRLTRAASSSDFSGREERLD